MLSTTLPISPNYLKIITLLIHTIYPTIRFLILFDLIIIRIIVFIVEFSIINQ